jgi:cell division protein FtsQ
VSGGPAPRVSTSQRVSGLLYAFILAAAAIVAMAAWMGGSLGSVGGRMGDGVDAIMRAAGFGVRTIAVIGLDGALEQRALEASGVSEGQSMLAADPEAIRKRIEEMDAVGAASVQRLWPGQITIVAETRTPVALWNDGGQWRVVDAGGDPFTEAMPEQHSQLPRIRGKGAAQAVSGLLEAMEAYPALGARFQSAERVGERRWTIILTGDIELALPEDERLTEALEAINLLHARSRVLELPVVRIDARHPDQIALRPSVPEPPPMAAPGDA